MWETWSSAPFSFDKWHFSLAILHALETSHDISSTMLVKIVLLQELVRKMHCLSKWNFIFKYIRFFSRVIKCLLAHQINIEIDCPQITNLLCLTSLSLIFSSIIIHAVHYIGFYWLTTHVWPQAVSAHAWNITFKSWRHALIAGLWPNVKCQPEILWSLPVKHANTVFFICFNYLFRAFVMCFSQLFWYLSLQNI
jgi:hypothetical protein